ncbi:PotD/PotF family extracellular solute-binding protein [Terricaulis sp.]|uniref:PotD/PotF family extracellular solute-binding protein n=1 Tax=Terricaulis sp. TaxID=2768686 RepID=UPI0037834DC4
MAKSSKFQRASRRSLLQGAAAVGLTFGAGGLTACGGGDGGRRVNFHNWTTYIGETTLADFRQATGIPVHDTYFASNDELFAQLRAGNPGYDVIVPSNEYVTRMAQAQMLQELDKSKIPNASNILPEFQDAAYDPGRKYSMPYTWLVIGIGYRKSKVDGVPDSWKWLMDSNKYARKIALLGESADLIRLGAKYLGSSINGIPEARISEVEQMFMRQKPNILRFHSDDGQDLLAAGTVDLVMEYNGDIAQLMTEDDDIDFVVPKEGSMLNSDTLCIPNGAPHPEEAHAFINYLLDGEAGAKIATTIQYATPNGAAKALMPDSYKNNPVVYPPADVMARCEYGAFEGDERAQLYEQIYTRISAASGGE